MKATVGCNFHNRFVIEVRDKNTNELKQKGYAENIILNRAWERVCNFQSYFTRIVFGTGDGILNPESSSMFSWLGQKVAEVEEEIWAFPTSSITKKIRLEPEEYIDDEITEVGITEHSTNNSSQQINTHALILDSEGSELKIIKTALDVVTIYATVYITLEDSNDVIFTGLQPNFNELLNYFINRIEPSKYILLSNAETINKSTPSSTVDYYLANKSTSVENKKVTYNVRIGVVDANQPIYELGLDCTCKVKIPQSTVFSPFSFTDVLIGTGDNSETHFDIPHIEARNLVVKVNNSVVSNSLYSYQSGDLTFLVSFCALGEIDSLLIENLSKDLSNIEKIFAFTKKPKNNTFRDGGSRSIGCILKVNQNIKSSDYKINIPKNDYSTSKIEGSNDKSSWVTISSLSPGYAAKTVDITNDYDYLKATYSTNYIDNRTATPMTFQKKSPKRNCIIFNTPPAIGEVITASYDVDYIPKDENHILDVEFTLQFGEGV